VSNFVGATGAVELSQSPRSEFVIHVLQGRSQRCSLETNGRADINAQRIAAWKSDTLPIYERIISLMMNPAFIFDGRNSLDHQKLFELGLYVYAVGRAGLSDL
jgi:hypothetical protein